MILWRLIQKVSIRKVNVSLWLVVTKEQQGQTTLESEKAHITGEFVIVTKYGDHVLCCLSSSLSNVIRQVGR